MICDPATALFYETRASSYSAATAGLDMSGDYARFLPRIVQSGHILDAGSGSGRDTLAFIRLGYRVTAFDASRAMCDCSAALTGQPTACRSFLDVHEADAYDGIWASASLLHVELEELPPTWRRLIRALAPGGSIYASFKRGDGYATGPDGRRFTLLDEDTVSGLATDFDLVDVDVRRSGSIAGRRDEWLSLVATKRRR